MLFKSSVCDKCENIYDAVERQCPKCGGNNSNPDAHKNHRGITWLPRWQEIVFFLVGWLGLNVIGLIVSFSFQYLNAVENKVLYMAICQFVTYGILFFGLIALVLTNHRNILKAFKKATPYVMGVLIGVGVLFFNSIYNRIISSFIELEVNENESLIRQMTVAFPILSVIIFVFVGPICEELTYRLGLFSFFARFGKWVAYLVTILVFALIHFDFMAESTDAYIIELLNLPSYMVAGAALCFAYHYFGLASSMTAHILNNLVAISSILILNGIG
jgi:membrane protease YdiL (CAAX protease family)